MQKNYSKKGEEMSKRIIFTSLLIGGLLLSACATQITASPTAEAVATAAEPALKLSGTAEAAWTADELKAMNMVEAEYTNKDGVTTKYSGVLISDLLSAAGVSDYTKITLIAADGFSAEVTKDELAACTNCIVAFQDDGTLRTVMPGLSSKQNVKGLVEIAVQ